MTNVQKLQMKNVFSNLNFSFITNMYCFSFYKILTNPVGNVDICILLADELVLSSIVSKAFTVNKVIITCEVIMRQSICNKHTCTI